MITEGLRSGDLDGLVLPMISIDEYESKINRDAIVIGFYVTDVEPAKDLNRFVQKSAIPLLDTDVSPAPTPEGYYMVFVEIKRDDKTAGTIINLCKIISNLTNIKKWSARIYKVKAMVEVGDALVAALSKKDK